MTAIKDAVLDISECIHNPNASMLPSLNTLLDYSNDTNDTVLDPSNPVVFLLENACVFALASAEHHEQSLMKAYPSMATSRDELYHHMTDNDFNIFATPGNTVVRLSLSKSEIKNKAVDMGDGTMRMVIPKDTEFTVGGFPLTMQHPIIISVLAHGGLQIRYDSDYVSPILELSTNLVEWEEVTIPIGGDVETMVTIKIPLLQYKIAYYTESLVAGRSFNKTYLFDDRFYLIRAFVTSTTGWKELLVTHSTMIVDSLYPTVQITVMENMVSVYLPDIYVRNGLVDGDIRIDVYTTQGEVSSNISAFNSDQFAFTLRDIDSFTDAKYYNVIKTFSNLVIGSDTTLDGGTDEVTWVALRENVINNSMTVSPPIVSELALTEAFEDRGFTLNKFVDYVTERIYHAIAIMPDSTIEDVSEPIGAISAYLTTSMAELEELDSIKINSDRVTITPDTLYLYASGETTISTTTIAELKLLTPDQLIIAVNDQRYLYSPYHYVLDDTDSIIDLRAYYMAKPAFYSKRFVEYNQTLSIDLTIGSYAIESVSNGYRILISTSSDDTYKEIGDDYVGAQLLFNPTGYTAEYAYIDGSMLGINDDRERIFEFIIETNLDIDKVHNLIVTNAIFNTTNATNQGMALDVDINIIFYVNGVNLSVHEPINADSILHGGTEDQALTHEILKLKLGDIPEGQWVNATTIAGSIEYATYPDDVYLTYEVAELERDADGLPILVDGDDGKEVVIIHKRGDIVYDDNTGEPVVRFKAGSTMYDSQGNPVIANDRSVNHRLELLMLDAKYIFATTDEVAEYLDLTISQILKDSMIEIPAIQSQLLERTELYVYPKNTIGDIQIKFDGDNSIYTPSEIDFTVTFYVTSINRQDSTLTATLTKIAKEVINANLKLDVFSTDMVLKDINDAVGDDIDGVVLEPFGYGGGGYIMSSESITDKPTIAKRLIVNADKSIGLKDKINVNFIAR